MGSCVPFPCVSADPCGEASADIKEIATRGSTLGVWAPPAGERWAWRRRPPAGPPRVRWQRPTGIRNGGLLLAPVAVAALMALVDQPVGPDAFQRAGRVPPVTLLGG
jgi:hypothetical protein